MAYQLQAPARAATTQSLLSQVLGITAIGLCVSALAVVLLPNVGSMVGLIAMIVGFVLLFAIARMQGNPAVALTLFYVFTFVEGVGIAPIVQHYLHLANGADVVFNAALTTGLGMFALAAVVYATGLDLRRFQGYLMLALVGLIIVGIISAFVHFVSPSIYSWITLAIFTGFVLIDFARIRAGGDGQAPVWLAVSIYLDVINIFLALLQLFGSRRVDD